MNEIVVLWQNQSNTWWNETCAQIIEQFGLPGNKYTTEITADFMSFKFKNTKDALLCKILISESL